MYRHYIHPPNIGGYGLYFVDENLWISRSLENIDYVKYLKWVENGGVPEVIPYPRPPGM